MNDLINIDAINTLDLTSIKDASLIKESESLAALQSKIMSGAAKLAGNIETIRREQAAILYRIQATKLYERDNFKSLADYAETIGLNKSNAHALAAAGKVYADKNAPEQLTSLTPSKLATLTSTINANKEQVYKDAAAGALDGMTQSQLKDYAAATKSNKAKIVKTYIGVNAKTSPMTLDEIVSMLGEHGTEVVKIPDKDGFKRYVRIASDGEHAVASVHIFTEYKPNSNGESKVTKGKSEFLARAAAEGMSDEQIKQVCRVMGW